MVVNNDYVVISIGSGEILGWRRTGGENEKFSLTPFDNFRRSSKFSTGAPILTFLGSTSLAVMNPTLKVWKTSKILQDRGR